ncbi:MAG: HAD family hydrolase [Gemmatimonadota bacterium]
MTHPPSARRVAVFLDRDGTIIEDAHYLADPEGVRLLAGVAAPVAALNAADILVIVITNQSGIAQGLLSESQYEATRERMEALLAEQGARIDDTVHCPHYPSLTGMCDCRKPATGMFLRAANRHGIDLARSLFIGDKRRDVEPGLQLGGTGILVPSDATPLNDVHWARAHAFLRPSLGEAVELWRTTIG